MTFAIFNLTCRSEAVMSTNSKVQQIKKDLREFGADPFLIAAEAIERGDRLADQVNRLQQVLAQEPDLTIHEPHCSGLCECR